MFHYFILFINVIIGVTLCKLWNTQIFYIFLISFNVLSLCVKYLYDMKIIYVFDTFNWPSWGGGSGSVVEYCLKFSSQFINLLVYEIWWCHWYSNTNIYMSHHNVHKLHTTFCTAKLMYSFNQFIRSFIWLSNYPQYHYADNNVVIKFLPTNFSGS